VGIVGVQVGQILDRRCQEPKTERMFSDWRGRDHAKYMFEPILFFTEMLDWADCSWENLAHVSELLSAVG